MHRLLFLLLLLLAPVMRAQSPNDSAQALLKTLYRVHDQGNGPLLSPGGGAERRRLFTESLAAALDSEFKRADPEAGTLDFDPFYNAQDTEVGEFDIAVAKVSGDATVGLVRFSNFGEPFEIAYRIVRERGGWYIDDIEYAEGNSLRKTLAGQ